MTFRLGPVTVLGLGLLAATFMSTANAADAGKGKVLAYTCHGCHGVPDYKNAYPNYRVPKLGGQNEAYIVSALNAYAKGERPHPTMHAQAVTLTDEERADIAAFLHGAGPLPSKDVAGTPPPATQTCVACHGADGAKTVAPDYPMLAGQYPEVSSPRMVRHGKAAPRRPRTVARSRALSRIECRHRSASRTACGAV